RDTVQPRHTDPEDAVRLGYGHEQQGIAAGPEHRAAGGDHAGCTAEHGDEVVPIVAAERATEEEVPSIRAPLEAVDRGRAVEQTTGRGAAHVHELDPVAASSTPAIGDCVRELLPVG